MPDRPCSRTAQSGFTYLLALMMIALIGMGLAAAGSLWRTESRRAGEAELLFIGNQYRQAIRSYYELDPAHPKLPQRIEDLLEDNRRPNAVRHLRRTYSDPLTGAAFELIQAPANQGIQGVYSNAPGRPFKTAGFLNEDRAFAHAESYSNWTFVYELPAPKAPQTSSPPKKP